MAAFYVAGFGILGVLSRFGVNEIAKGVWRHPFPAATLGINTVGSFLIGLLFVLGMEGKFSYEVRSGLIVGFLGGFTTFSAFSLETLLLMQQGRYAVAMAYFLSSPVLGLAAAAAGMRAARSL